jgi:hypothetical protein
MPERETYWRYDQTLCDTVLFNVFTHFDDVKLFHEHNWHASDPGEHQKLSGTCKKVLVSTEMIRRVSKYALPKM